LPRQLLTGVNKLAGNFFEFRSRPTLPLRKNETRRNFGAKMVNTSKVRAAKAFPLAALLQGAAHIVGRRATIGTGGEGRRRGGAARGHE